jgi:hypothetical protein
MVSDITGENVLGPLPWNKHCFKQTKPNTDAKMYETSSLLKNRKLILAGTHSKALFQVLHVRNYMLQISS